HPVRTPRAVGELVAAGVALRRAARRQGADLVHANSTRAGLAAVVARALGGPPAVVHVHDRLGASRATRAIARVLRRGASALLAISRAVADDLAAAGPGAPVHVVHNPIDLERFDPATTSRDAARAGLGLPAHAPLLGLIAQITPWKGQEDAIRALARVRREHPEARLLLVGEVKFAERTTSFDNPAYERGLRALVAELGLTEAVAFWGERDDVPAILAALDVALVPSWDEPLGRSVLEAMAMGRPVVATAVGGPAELIEDGVTGRLVAPRDPRRWAAVIAELLGDPTGRERLGAAARPAVAGWEKHRYSERVAHVYRVVLAAP
ncbi:MAG TPA: glycosyltransferase family 4 protein, partial [Solirubrobacteraceae bacterium]